jgi:acetyl-CoA carboxylase carboxyltransferase component
MERQIADLNDRREQARAASGFGRTAKNKGKMLARERIAMLLDPGSFNELDLLARHRVHDVGLEERPYTDA